MKKQVRWFGVGSAVSLGCIGLVALYVAIIGVLAFLFTKLIQWGFHTPFPQTFVVCFVAMWVLGALGNRGSK